MAADPLPDPLDPEFADATFHLVCRRRALALVRAFRNSDADGLNALMRDLLPGAGSPDEVTRAQRCTLLAMASVADRLLELRSDPDEWLAAAQRWTVVEEDRMWAGGRNLGDQD